MSHFFRSVLRQGAAAAALLGLAHATLAQTLPAQPASAGLHLPSSQLQARTAAEASRQAAIAAQPTRRNSRIGGHLQRLYSQVGGSSSRLGPINPQLLRSDFPNLKFNKDASKVAVHITAQDVNALLPSLLSRGFQTTASYPELHFVEGLLPVSELAPGSAGIEGLASRGLLGVLPALKPRVRGGLVTSQADYALEAARTRATRPKNLTGAGVRIGVLSDSYNALGGAAADVASGDLPAAGVQVLSDLDQEYQFGTDEGRAMCQLINDLAPGSPMAFSSVYFNFAQQILNLANPSLGNCRVLVDDIYQFDEPFYQDGVIAQAVNQVVGQGVAYFSAAGNFGNKSYENNAPVFTQSTVGTQTAYRLNFDVTGATAAPTQTVTLSNGQSFEPILQWSDPFYTANGVKTDLDMYLIAVKNGVPGDTVARSDDNNLLSRTPLEILSYSNSTATSGTTTFNFVIVRRNGTANPSRLKYIDAGQGSGATGDPTFTFSSTIVGHPAAAGAQAVAAAGYANQRVAESFTSLGGALPFLFGPTGTSLGSVQTRQKPDITSIDGTDTSFFPQYSGADIDKNGYPNFFGTSAAAPHAAAVAALLLQSEPGLTPAQVYSRLASTARRLGTSASDPQTGAGLLDAYTAIYGLAAGPPALQDFELGAIPMSWTVNSTGAGRVRVTSLLGPASGNYHLVLDAPYGLTYTGATTRSLNEATWYLTNLGSNVQLTFRERKQPGETDEQMPAQFTGSSNSDGVALSVDGGTTWYRVFDLTGTNATTTYQTKTVNLSQIASANGLTLGSDVRLKFQQYGGTGITSVALANQRGRLFDDIALTGASAAPIPFYTASQPTAGCPGLQVQYTDTSALRPTGWAWTFPGGTPSTSTARNPLVTYNTPGHFGVTLSVSNASGTATRADTGVVYIYGRAPLAVVGASATSVCPGSQVTFSSTASYCPSTFAWSFPGGSPSTATTQNPGAITYAAAGTYAATLTVSNSYGSSTTTQTIEVTKGRSLPYTENFNASLSLPAGWTVVNPDGKFTWAVRDTTIGRDGTRSRVLRAPFAFDPNTGERDAVYTPAIDLTNVSSPSLQFDLAYTTATSGGTTYSDSLQIQVADACSGAILGRAYNKGGATLATAATRAALFVPRSGADWRRETVNLSAYAGRSVVLRFVGYNDYGNGLYLDNLLVSGTLLATTSAAATVGLEAWPVPAPGGSALNVRLPAYSGQVELRLLDALGRVVWREQLSQSGGTLERTLPLPAAAGAYTLLYQPATGTSAARKLLVQ
ncbi:PKD domain-containing protein [Hymenobacter sp. RP-2-7]|uniref:PKD domain-containing protein n=1 Tax=Hymenobacter polaris TaxID=2682546 RepID=A0A7Y0FPD2_9BACT|nr:PKD domain-containing protein [Hymenobacter polaris]NML67425.1 PKD domain-containing protein [Hymenobacter polaris]